MFSIFSAKAISQKPNPKYDSVLAKRLGADDYGMKKYILVLLATGENKSTDKKHKDSCFVGHLNNIGQLAKDRKLIVAGPFGKNDKDYRGLFILNVKTEEEANKLLSTDPAIVAQYLKPVLLPWYGSAALEAYLEASEKCNKLDF